MKRKSNVISTCVILVSNVLNTSLTDTEKCMCWFFAFCCINLVAMLIAKVYFEIKEYYYIVLILMIEKGRISKCTLVSMCL